MHRQSLEVRSFDRWNESFDDILERLPTTELLPPSLFRQLMLTNPEQKRALAFYDRGDPVGLLGLRCTRNGWNALTNWIVPGILCPAKPGYQPRILDSAGLGIDVAWWRHKHAPPKVRSVCDLRRSDTHRLNLRGNFEGYWRQGNHFKNIRASRNRCKGLELDVDVPGSSEWVIRHTTAKWDVDPVENEDRVVAARFLQAAGLHHALILRDGTRRVGGVTVIQHGDTIVAENIWRDPAYERNGLGVRLIDLSVQWAVERGFRIMDFGGEIQGCDTYKVRWAPPAGEKWTFRVLSGVSLRLQEAVDGLRAVRSRVRAWSAGPQAPVGASAPRPVSGAHRERQVGPQSPARGS
jgi:GNAT superfamily N-acetyltransferase